MNHYKEEQEKQDKEFDKQLRLSLYNFKACTPDYNEINIQEIKEHVNDFLKSRDTALLEAFKKDVGEMIVGLKKEFWDDQDHVVGGYISRKEINDLLKDYNPEKI